MRPGVAKKEKKDEIKCAIHSTCGIIINSEEHREEAKGNKEQMGQVENNRKMVDLNHINNHIECKLFKDFPYGTAGRN